MTITIEVPTKASIVNGGFEIKVASEGEEWSKAQLGDYAGKSGVYIHYSNGKILYIGKTTEGKWGAFGERLRREFQEKASGSSSLYHILKSQDKPIYTYFLDLQDIDMTVDQGPMQLSAKRKALIMEQVLIGIFEPEGNKV